MRWTLAALLGSALVAQRAVAELTFTVTASRNGVPIPQSEIKLVPYQFGRSRMGSRQWPDSYTQRKKTRRSNPIADSANWCGSVTDAPSGKQIQLIHGVFQHPECSSRNGVSLYPQAAAAWTGIDGDDYESALLQAGTVCKINSANDDVVHEAWWQWVPGAAFTIASMTVQPEDWFEVTLNTSSNTAAEITITNLSRSQTYTVDIVEGPALARVEADWVVERPYYGGALAGFASFTDVWFEQAYATLTGSSAELNVVGAKQYQIPDLCFSQEWESNGLVAWSA